MRFPGDLKRVLAVLVISLSLTGLAQSNEAGSATTPPASKSSGTEKHPPSQRSDTYSGYSVDGRTSASVLAAKRSHAVSKEDETGLAVYSGLIVIGLIVFFAHALSKKK